MGIYGYSGAMTTPLPRETVDIDLSWTIGDRLRKVRRSLGLSQEEFGELLGAKKPRYVAWETDRNLPQNLIPLAQRIEVLTAGRVPAAWILGVDRPVSMSVITGRTSEITSEIS